MDTAGLTRTRAKGGLIDVAKENRLVCACIDYSACIGYSAYVDLLIELYSLYLSISLCLCVMVIISYLLSSGALESQCQSSSIVSYNITSI